MSQPGKRCGVASALVAFGFSALLSLPAGPAGASDAVEDIVQVLKEEGLIDEATEQQILVKNDVQRSYAPSVDDGFEFMKGFEWSGDLRLRNEQFWFDRGDFDSTARDDRNRWRYRLRFGFKKEVNDWFTVGARFASGFSDHRSTNQSLGDGGADDFDFHNDEIAIDRAWVQFKMPELGALKHKLVAGKVGNPFYQKNGKDYLIFDHDITPEGIHYSGKFGIGENAELFTNIGFYLIEERSTNADPKLAAFQLGGSAQISETMEAGLRCSYYSYRSLDDDFIDRNLELGMLPGGFGDRAGRDNDLDIGELYAFVKLKMSKDWPVLFFGQWVQNLDAKGTDGIFVDPSFAGQSVGDEDTAWGVGIEVGNAKKWFRFGFGWYSVEANSVAAVYTDSDLFDGTTNREGWTAYLDRQLADRVNLKITYFDGDLIEDDPLFNLNDAGENAERQRLQTDLVLKF